MAPATPRALSAEDLSSWRRGRARPGAERAEGYRRYRHGVSRHVTSLTTIGKTDRRLARVVRCVRLVGLRGFLVSGPSARGGPGLEISEGFFVRRLGALGRWVREAL